MLQFVIPGRPPVGLTHGVVNSSANVIRTATPADLPELAALLSRANDTRYDLARVAAEKCFGKGLRGEPVTRIYDDFEGVAVTCGRYLRLLAVRDDRRGRGIGSSLLSDAEARGATIVGAEPGNYFTPGCPEKLVPFFQQRGYEATGETDNMEVDLLAIPELENARARRASTADRERVLSFVEENFGASWRFECAPAFSNTPPTIFITGEKETITGFAAHDANNRGLGFFGPTGVAESQRGRRLGRDLLLATLADMRRLGYQRAVIPWTDAIRFYEKSCGAVKAGRFVILRSPEQVSS
jgi:GNAT superfamily N-acetyltransferase